jgi:hypothetical protein
MGQSNLKSKEIVLENKEIVLENKKNVLEIPSFIFNKDYANEFINKLPISSKEIIMIMNADKLSLIHYNILAGIINCEIDENILFVYCCGGINSIEIGEHEYIGCTNKRIFSVNKDGNYKDNLFSKIKHTFCKFEIAYSGNESNALTVVYASGYSNYYHIQCKISCRFFNEFINTLVVNNKPNLGIKKKNNDEPPPYN